MDVIEKLKAALDETEQTALAASGPKGVWTSWETSEYFGYETPHVLIGIGNQRQPLAGGHFTYTPVEKRFADHIIRNDPAHVLRQVAAHRELIATYEQASAYYNAHKDAPAGEVHGLYTAIKLIAKGYGVEP